MLVYVLNKITDKEIVKEKGKVFASFADLKAVFNKMDRKILKEKMMEIGVTKKY